MQIHPPHLRDERLAWLAVEPALRHGFWGRLFGRGKKVRVVDDSDIDAAPAPDSPGLAIGEAGGQPIPPYDIGRPEPAHPDRGTVVTPTGGQSASPGQDSFPMSRKMQRYAVAVDRVVPRMSADERARLRATGKVPAWFLDAVKKEFKAIHF
jgi:hypothetical protein